MKVRSPRKRIMIKGAWYTISQQDLNPDKSVSTSDWGECSYTNKTITLDTDLPEVQYIPVLAHEISHAILRESDVDIFIDKILEKASKGATQSELEDLAIEIEEAVCNAMEVGHKAYKNI